MRLSVGTRLLIIDERGEPVFGPLPSERPHQLKTQLIYDFSFGASVALKAYVASGTPITRAVWVIPPHNYPVNYLGRQSDGRTPTRTQIDVLVQHEIRLGIRFAF